MAVVVLVVVVAVLVGYTRGGSLARLSTLALPGWPLVVAALAVQAIGGLVSARGSAGGTAYAVGLLVSAVLVTLFVARNRELPGMRLVAAGFVLNAIVVTANGAMPVSRWAASRAGIEVGTVVRGGGRHEVADAGTRLRPLGDVIPAPMPVERASSVLSVGDVVLTAGLGVLVVGGMTTPSGRRRRGGRRQSRSWASA